MDMRSNIFSSILCTKFFKIVDTHGAKYNLGSTAGVGYQYNTITINTLLYLQHNHNLPTWILFTDLVKAIDIYNHELMVCSWSAYH